eukprot:413344_1
MTPYLFMQITSIDEDLIHVDVVMNKPMNQKRKCFVKEIMGNNNDLTRTFVFAKGKVSDKVRIGIDEEHDSIYHFGLYNSRKSIDRISNSNTIKSTILKDKSKYPPQNMSYKPNCINESNILKLKDENNNKINIYWNIPSLSFGVISYKIININTNKE